MLCGDIAFLYKFMNKNTIELRGGEIAAAKVFEITSIPTLENLQEGFRVGDDIEDAYRKAFISLLTEVHQSYINYQKERSSIEVSVESLWITEKIENQPFKAKIKLFFMKIIFLIIKFMYIHKYKKSNYYIN